MSEIGSVCREVVSRLDGAIACGVVDLVTGSLLGAHDRDGVMKDGLFATATTDLLGGANLARVLELGRGDATSAGPAQTLALEIRIATGTRDRYAKIFKQGEAVIVLEAERRVNVGMVWAQLKASVSRLESLVP
ncbi:MAG: hypothetical protein IT186_25855 [Acidobacteria bacterium]|nr:hypothetical protein [Acidobacteriota bacterium]MCG3192460.1 hypothetical protein [Thermoanaerobaculia bacterium]MCK6681848.1 hypothetical protein [Thermoanaerobaculia bacterium]